MSYRPRAVEVEVIKRFFSHFCSCDLIQGKQDI